MFNSTKLSANKIAFINDCAQFIEEEKKADIHQRLDIIGDRLNFIPHVFTGFLAEKAETYGLNYTNDYNTLLDQVLRNQVDKNHITQQDYTNIKAYLNAPEINTRPGSR